MAPIDLCDPCAALNGCLGTIDDELFRRLTVQILCQLATDPPAPPAPAPADAELLAAQSGAAAAVLSASWTATTFLSTAPHKLSGGFFENGTDVIILGSFDGGTTTHFRVEPGGLFEFNYGANGAVVTADTDLSIKSGSGADGTIGNWNVSGFYV